MANTKAVYYDDFSGGLNTTSSPRKIKRNEASLLRNWDITFQGQLVRRDGITQTGDTMSGTISGLHAYVQTDGDKDIILTEGTNLRYLNSTTFDALDSGFTAGTDFSMVTVPSNNKVYLGNEENTIHYWDRASTTLNSCLTDLGADVPHGNVLVWHKNHMFTVNNVTFTGATYPNRMYWSALGDPETWDTTNDFIDMPGGGRIITIVDWGDALVIFKERSYMFLTGWADADWRITATNTRIEDADEAVGMVSPKGAVRVGDEIWFIDDEANIRRLYKTQYDTFRRDIISKKLKDTTDGFNKTQLEKAKAWVYNDKVYFAVPNGNDTYNSIVLVYDILASNRTGEEAWTTYTGWTPSHAISYPTSTTPDLYMAFNDKKVYKHEGDDDAGVAIDARWDSKEDDLDNPTVYKMFIQGDITGESAGNVDVEIHAAVDNAQFADMGDLNLSTSGGTLGPTGTFELGPTGTTAVLAGPSSGDFTYYYATGGGDVEGKTIKHSIRHAVVDEQPTVNGYTCYYKPRKAVV